MRTIEKFPLVGRPPGTMLRGDFYYLGDNPCYPICAEFVWHEFNLVDQLLTLELWTAHSEPDLPGFKRFRRYFEDGVMCVHSLPLTHDNRIHMPLDGACSLLRQYLGRKRTFWLRIYSTNRPPDYANAK